MSNTIDPSALDEWNAYRNQVAKEYLEKANISNLSLPFVPSWAEPVWHLFVVRYPKRQELEQHLNQAGISTLVHYPVPPHLSNAYIKDGYQIGDFSITEQLSREVLSLPIGPHITNEEVKRVIEVLQQGN